MGSTGNIYTVTIGHVPTCSCPNFVKGNAQCKHILYVLCKVLKAPGNLSYQLAFLTSELHEIFDNAGPVPTESAAARDKDGKRKPVEGECPICVEELDAATEEIVWCHAACGNNLHKTCFDQWAATKRAAAKSLVHIVVRHGKLLSISKPSRAPLRLVLCVQMDTRISQASWVSVGAETILRIIHSGFAASTEQGILTTRTLNLIMIMTISCRICSTEVLRYHGNTRTK